jgi:hypothetical protein
MAPHSCMLRTQRDVRQPLKMSDLRALVLFGRANGFYRSNTQDGLDRRSDRKSAKASTLAGLARAEGVTK